MGTSFSSNSQPLNQISEREGESLRHRNPLENMRNQIKNQQIQLQQLKNQLLVEYSNLDQSQKQYSLNRKQCNQMKQERRLNQANCQQIQVKLFEHQQPQQANRQIQKREQQTQVKQNEIPQTHQLMQQNQRLSRISVSSSIASDLNQFRSSFYTDRTQSTIYLEPPGFVLRSPFLLNMLNRTLYQFFNFSEFIGSLGIKLYKVAVYFVFVQLIINFVLISFSESKCLYTKNSGIIQLSKWMTLDCVITSFILILLTINTYLISNFKPSSIRRGPQYINNSLHIIQCSWIILYTLKFFVLNSIGSAQLFTYTMNYGPSMNFQQQTSLNLKQVIQREKQETWFAQNINRIQCPIVLNWYLASIMIYNYISIVFLCVYVIQNLV